MNAAKPYRPILVIDPEHTDPQTIPDGEYAFAMEWSMDNGDRTRDMLDRLIRDGRPFLLLISDMTVSGMPGADKEAPPVEIPEIIPLCLFSRNYIRIGEAPVLAFMEPGAHFPAQSPIRSPARTPESLILQLKPQGWPLIRQWMVSSALSFNEQVRAKRPAPLLLTGIDMNETDLLESFFSEPCYLGNDLLIKGKDLATSVSLEQDFSALCKSAIGDHPPFNALLSAYLSMQKAWAGSDRENNVLSERLKNAEMTIGIIKTKYKDDYDLLFRWYQHEYEVLPLWYKRFGHIIKVITGKRTARSLFNDSVKKYKE